MLINTDFCHRIDGTAVLYCTVLYCTVLYSTATNPWSESIPHMRYNTTTICLRGKIKTRKKPNTGIDRIVLLNGLANRSIIQRTFVVFLKRNECAKGKIVLCFQISLSATERKRTVKFVEIYKALYTQNHRLF